MSATEFLSPVWKFIKKGFLWIFILGFLSLVSWFMFIYFANYSEGSRTGYITKISHKGVVFKTWEGELNFGFFGVGGQNGRPSENIWQFSVSDDKVARQIQDASETGHKVTLLYKQKYRKIFFRGDTEYLVYQVESVKE